MSERKKKSERERRTRDEASTSSLCEPVVSVLAPYCEISSYQSQSRFAGAPLVSSPPLDAILFIGITSSKNNYSRRRRRHSETLNPGISKTRRGSETRRKDGSQVEIGGRVREKISVFLLGTCIFARARSASDRATRAAREIYGSYPGRSLVILIFEPRSVQRGRPSCLGDHDVSLASCLPGSA